MYNMSVDVDTSCVLQTTMYQQLPSMDAIVPPVDVVACVLQAASAATREPSIDAIIVNDWRLRKRLF